MTAQPLDQVQAATQQIASTWTLAGQPSRFPTKMVDVPAARTAAAVTPAQFAAGYRSSSNAMSAADFIALAFQLAGRTGVTPAVSAAAAPPAPIDWPAPPPGGYRTPDGHEYIPPKIGGHPAIPLLRHHREKGRHVAFLGRPGTGKTTCAQVVFGDDLVVLACDGSTDRETIVGRWEQDRHNPAVWVWREGKGAYAARMGLPLLVDEVNRATSEAQDALLPLMDHRRFIDVHENSEIGRINAAPGFMVILAWNPSPFIEPLREGLESRASLTVTFDSVAETAAQLGVPTEFVLLTLRQEGLAQTAAANGGVPVWVPSLRTLLYARDQVQEGLGKTFAAMTIVGTCPEPDQRTEVATYLGHSINDTVPGGHTANFLHHTRQGTP